MKVLETKDYIGMDFKVNEFGGKVIHGFIIFWCYEGELAFWDISSMSMIE